jgi:hypothetical protein
MIKAPESVDFTFLLCPDLSRLIVH